MDINQCIKLLKYLFVQALLQFKFKSINFNSIFIFNHSPMTTNYNDRLLEQIRRQLWSIGTISPEMVQGSIMGLLGTGCEEQLMYLLRQAIMGNSQYAFMLSYIQLIDNLLYFPYFNHMLHNYLIQFYTDVFNHLNQYGHREPIEKMKIIRKYWLGRINPMLYYHLGESVANKCQEDVDDLPKEAFQGVKRYFQEVLRMPENEISYHLPTLYGRKTIFQQNKYPKARIVYKVRKNELKQTKPRCQIPESNLKIINTQQKDDISVVIGISLQKQKRIRYPSVETNLSNGSQSPHYLDQDIIVLDNRSLVGKKDTENDQLIIKAKSLLSQLDSLFQYSCKECGLKFNTKVNHHFHVQTHIQSKLETYRAAKRMIKPNCQFNRHLLNEKQWGSTIGTGQDEESVLQMQENETVPMVCCFCKQLMEIQFTRQRWLVKKAVMVLIDEKSMISHKHCMLTFQEEQQTK